MEVRLISNLWGMTKGQFSTTGAVKKAKKLTNHPMMQDKTQTPN